MSLVNLRGTSQPVCLPTIIDCDNLVTACRWFIAVTVQVLLLVVSGHAKSQQVDAAGLSSLAVLRLMGLPSLQVVVQGEADASLKDRSAAKKRAQAAVAGQVCASATFLLLLSWASCYVPPAPGTVKSVL